MLRVSLDYSAVGMRAGSGSTSNSSLSDQGLTFLITQNKDALLGESIKLGPCLLEGSNCTFSQVTEIKPTLFSYKM